ncbi:hypothetical protein BRADI_2g07603v3 [Brachypodium distachyon]|uniref:Uncharacterized protein n=1 Tax=Brachypodium distachyon TaxID=15368 RepID=A0A2K2D7E3_BRADI|nr:hypothetical protein BRADI_2g07603v3 [Brachypodium distachyon]
MKAHRRRFCFCVLFLKISNRQKDRHILYTPHRTASRRVVYVSGNFTVARPTMAVSPLAVLLPPLLAFVVSLLYLLRSAKNKKKPGSPHDGRQSRRLPPSPGRGLPLIGHLHLLG